MAEEAQVADGRKDPAMKDFLTSEEEQQVVDGIRALEQRTHGEIRIYITSKRVLNPERYAAKAFKRMGMTHTKERNGALIVVMTRRRRFVILGDRGLNEIVPADYWEKIAANMSAHLKEGRRLEALTEGIRTIGDTMAEHWPADGENPDELPNEIAYD